jgi:hypothetical protein
MRRIVVEEDDTTKRDAEGGGLFWDENIHCRVCKMGQRSVQKNTAKKPYKDKATETQVFLETDRGRPMGTQTTWPPGS